MAGYTNITLTVPDGSQLYEQQLCTPASWTDILVFYLSNYVTHVATIKSYPGESSFDKFLALATALFLPVAGVGRGLDRLIRCARRGRTTLDKAARAGALCMVVRNTQWLPDEAQELLDVTSCTDSIQDLSSLTGRSVKQLRRKEAVTFMGQLLTFWHNGWADIAALAKLRSTTLCYYEGGQVSEKLTKTYVYQPLWQRDGSTWWEYLGIQVGSVMASRKLHGGVQYGAINGLETGLPLGYKLAFVPHDTSVASLDSQSAWTASESIIYSSEDNVVGSSDFVSGVASIVQLLFGLTTLYNAVGPQITHFGYAAFGLTVLPYTLISLINLLATLVTPEYSSVFLVESEVMHEAVTRGAKFKGVVGRLIPKASTCRAPESGKPVGRTMRTAKRQEASLSQPVDPNKHLARASVIEQASSSSSIATDHANSAESGKLSSPPVLVYSLLRASGNVTDLSSLPGQAEKAVDEAVVIYVANHPDFMRHHPPSSTGFNLMGWTTFSWCTLTGLLPLLPIGLLSQFRNAESTYAQRVVVMLWFAMGVGYGGILAKSGPVSQYGEAMVDADFGDDSDDEKVELESETQESRELVILWLPRMVYVFTFLPVAAPGFAGIVFAGMMYASFGTCNQVA